MYPVEYGVEKHEYLHMPNQSVNQYVTIMENLLINLPTSNAFHLDTAIPLSEILL